VVFGLFKKKERSFPSLSKPVDSLPSAGVRPPGANANPFSAALAQGPPQDINIPPQFAQPDASLGSSPQFQEQSRPQFGGASEPRFTQSKKPLDMSMGDAYPQAHKPKGGLVEKDLALISAKLDTIRSQLELMNSRLAKLEKIAEAESSHEKTW